MLTVQLLSCSIMHVILDLVLSASAVALLSKQHNCQRMQVTHWTHEGLLSELVAVGQVGI